MQNFVKVTVDRRARVMSSVFWFAGAGGQEIVTAPLRLEHGLLYFIARRYQSMKKKIVEFR